MDAGGARCLLARRRSSRAGFACISGLPLATYLRSSAVVCLLLSHTSTGISASWEKGLVPPTNHVMMVTWYTSNRPSYRKKRPAQHPPPLPSVDGSQGQCAIRAQDEADARTRDSRWQWRVTAIGINLPRTVQVRAP